MSDAFREVAERFGVARQPMSDPDAEGLLLPGSLIPDDGGPAMPGKAPPPEPPGPSSNGGATAAPTLRVRTLSSVAPETVRPLFGGRLLFGKLAALAGDGGVGKSYLMHALAAPLTTGAVLPGDKQPAGPCDVLFASYEDEAGDTIRPRLASLGADLDRVHVIDGVAEDGKRRSFGAADVDALGAELDHRRHVGMLVIDPVSAWVGGIDEHRQNEVRSALEGLRVLAAARGVAVVVIMHLRKSGADKALHRLNGSGAYGQLVRSAMVAAADPDSDDGACALAHIKHNLTGKAPTLGYRIDERGDFYWLGERDGLDGERLAGSDSGEERSGRDEAEAFLREVLEDGPRAAGEVLAEAADAGIAERTLKRAKKRLGVRSGKAGMEGPWSWSLPEDGPKDAKDAKEKPWHPSASLRGGGTLRAPADDPDPEAAARLRDMAEVSMRALGQDDGGEQ